VSDAVAHLGATPIEWLCDQAPVDRRWTFVHATHASATEMQRLRGAGATIAVCPSSEANLGAGAFPVEDWWKAGGSLAIGSGSNVGLDPAEELRWLEYQARLRRQARAVLVDSDAPHPGTALWRRAVAGGRRAMGAAHAGIAVGAPAELLLLESEPGLPPDEALDDFVFSRRRTRVLAAFVAQRHRVDAAPAVAGQEGGAVEGGANADDGGALRAV
jgi:formimidoylglutamate deiminase